MNSKERKQLDAIYQAANKLMDAPPQENPLVGNVAIIEALLSDIASVLACQEPTHIAKLVALDEAEKACQCPTPNVYHYKGCALIIARFKGYTSDGHRITDGMAVWDYNLEPGYVNLKRLGDDGWFEVCKRKNSDERGSLMNNVRVCVHHPYSGQDAIDALKNGVKK